MTKKQRWKPEAFRIMHAVMPLMNGSRNFHVLNATDADLSTEDWTAMIAILTRVYNSKSKHSEKLSGVMILTFLKTSSGCLFTTAPIKCSSRELSLRIKELGQRAIGIRRSIGAGLESRR